MITHALLDDAAALLDACRAKQSSWSADPMVLRIASRRRRMRNAFEF